MYRKRIVKIAGPSFLLLGSVMAFGAMRANVVSSTADAGPPYEQSAGDLPGLGQASKGPCSIEAPTSNVRPRPGFSNRSSRNFAPRVNCSPTATHVSVWNRSNSITTAWPL